MNDWRLWRYSLRVNGLRWTLHHCKLFGGLRVPAYEGCKACRGTGEWDEYRRCSSCGGSGVVKAREALAGRHGMRRGVRPIWSELAEARALRWLGERAKIRRFYLGLLWLSWLLMFLRLWGAL